MHFNYEACSYPEGSLFRFHATENRHAIDQMEVYMKEMNQEKIRIGKVELIPGKGEDVSRDSKEVAVLTRPEAVRNHETEYKVEVTYYRFVKYVGCGKETEFNAAARKFAGMIEIPELQGFYHGRPRVEMTHFTDDDRYGSEPDVVDITDRLSEAKQ